jgi:small subunit ribosomal protein S15
MAITAEAKAELVKAFGKTPTDTGSSEVQIAILTSEINMLQGHFKAHGKDHHSRRGLIRKVNLRRRLLDYLKKKNEPSYQEILKKLSLRR